MFSSKLPTTVFAPMALTAAAALCLRASAAPQEPAQQEIPAGSEVAPEVAQASPLDLAFHAVSKMPLRPHIKTRSRLQADLVQAALDVGRLDDASSWAAGIENWRRGLALAHIAVHHAKAGDEEAATKAIGVAEAFEATILGEDDQGWRRDRVRVRIAEAYGLIGNRAKAAQIQASATPSESGRLASMAVQTVADADAEKQMQTLETIAKTGDLEQIRYALLAMTEFYGRALGKPSDDEGFASPDNVEERIKAAWGELPIEPRIDIVERMIQFDVEAGSPAAERAAGHTAEIAALVTDNRWNAEQAIGLRARVAGLLQSTGDTRAARSMANEALALYETSREGIVNIYRGAALRPLAEAFLTLGDADTATTVYERALAEALENPNSRPRVTDLAMTAISVATAPGYEAPKTLLGAFKRASEGIGAPW